jgi:hypothetical protein
VLPDRPSAFYVEFKAPDPARLAEFEKVIAAVGAAKGLVQLRLSEEQFLPVLRSAAERGLEFRGVDGWTFDAAMWCLGDAECEVLGVRRCRDGRARVELDPWAGPYGGGGPTRALVEGFGFEVTEDTT